MYCRFVGYSDHENAYLFKDIKSRLVLVIHYAKFIEDVFDGGRRTQGEAEDVNSSQEDESTGHDFPSVSIQPDEEDAARDQYMERGSKRHARTPSLEQVVAIPVPKRKSRRTFLRNMSVVAQVDGTLRKTTLWTQW